MSIAVPPCSHPPTHLSIDRSVVYVATTATFMKGISGGPLLNEQGLVIGLNAFLRNDLAGLGFAIGINRVCDALDELLAAARVGGVEAESSVPPTGGG